VAGQGLKVFYVPASCIMYLSDFCRFLLCTCGWERRGERGAGEGGGARERGIDRMFTVSVLTVVCVQLTNINFNSVARRRTQLYGISISLYVVLLVVFI
jgi:hypothetical protein